MRCASVAGAILLLAAESLAQGPSPSPAIRIAPATLAAPAAPSSRALGQTGPAAATSAASAPALDPRIEGERIRQRGLSKKVVGYVLLGAGGAFTIGAVVCGILASQARDSLEGAMYKIPAVALSVPALASAAAGGGLLSSGVETERKGEAMIRSGPQVVVRYSFQF